MPKKIDNVFQYRLSDIGTNLWNNSYKKITGKKLFPLLDRLIARAIVDFVGEEHLNLVLFIFAHKILATLHKRYAELGLDYTKEQLTQIYETEFVINDDGRAN